MFGFSGPRLRLPIVFFDTAANQKREFTPLQKRVVTMYSCGPTVYDHIHIGNLRAYLVPDLIKRVLMYNGYQVKHTINFTDFGHLTDDGDNGEDKIMKGMHRDGFEITLENMLIFAEPYIESFKRDLDRFGVLAPTTYARASEYVRQQIKLIETLVEKGYAYETSDGVYFEVATFPDYGQLGNVDISALKAGARVEENPEKRHPADFALWKKGEMGWQSKYGTGFPGWHIECTAMAFATLGKQIDIHTGGEDLKYTHHNGEIAQAECCTGKHYVQYWLHNAHITLNAEKLAKSTGNVITLDELIDRGFTPQDYRYWLLQSHYRTTANFTDESLKASQQALTRLQRYVYEELGDQPFASPHEQYELSFLKAVNDDLDTPKALALLWDLVKDDNVQPAEKLATIHAMDTIFELKLSLPVQEGLAMLGHVAASELPEDIQDLVTERDAARAAQNWPESDRLREALKLKGYTVEDTSEGTKVSIA
jgi:cysteinyl-tRNA synthetase